MLKSKSVPAVLVALTLLGCSEAPFDYDKASKEQREQWLKPYADGMYDGLRAGLRSAGALEYFNVLNPSINANGRKIVVTARFKAPDAYLKGNKSKIRDTIMAELCPLYLRTMLDEANVTVRTSILRENGSTEVSAEQSRSSCASFT